MIPKVPWDRVWGFVVLVLWLAVFRAGASMPVRLYAASVHPKSLGKRAWVFEPTAELYVRPGVSVPLL